MLMSDTGGMSDIGLKIRVQLNDTEAREALTKLTQQKTVQLQFNSESLTAIKSQLEELSKLKMTTFANEETLAQFESVKQSLADQLKAAEQLKQAYESIKIPSDVKAYNRQQNAIYKEALAAQKQIQAEQQKMTGLTGEELTQRQAVLKDMETALANLKSQITDQQLLNRLASQQTLADASAKSKAQDTANAEKRKKEIKEEENLVVQAEERKKKAKTKQETESSRVREQTHNKEVLSYKLLTKFQNAIHQSKLKLLTADEQQTASLNNYIAALEKATVRVREIMFSNGIRNENKELELEIDQARKLYEIENQRAKLADQMDKKSYNQGQTALYQQASKLQKQLYQEQSKLNGLVGDERTARQELINRVQDQLKNVQSLITDENRLKKLEEERILLQNKNDGKALDKAQAEQKRKNAKEELAQNKANNEEQRNAYNYLFKAQNQLHQLKLKSIKADENELAVINKQIEAIQKRYAEQDALLSAKNLRSTNADNKLQTNADYNALEVERQIAALKDKQVASDKKSNDETAKEKETAERRVSLAQREFEIKQKQLLAGRNGDYVNLKALNDFQNALARLNGETNLKSVNKQIEDLRLQFRGLSVDANTARIQQTGGALTALNQSFKNLARYVTGAMVIRRFFSALREGIQDVKDLDSAMTTLRMTMNDFTERDISNLVDKSLELSKTLKTNVSDVLEAVKTVANAEETMESIMNKTKPALIISNLSGTSINDSVSMIQSAVRQFDDLKEATEAHTMSVANSLVSISKSLGMDFSEGINGMSEGLTILGSVANQFGMDLNETLSMLAATAETTRGTFSETATAIKTIMARTMRVGGISEDVSLDDMLKTGMGIKASPTAIIQ